MRPGDQLIQMCAMAEHQVVICAPFVKVGAVTTILETIPPRAAIEVFTRWRPEEVAAGVSDPAVLSLVQHRGGTLHLCDRLHAKYTRVDTKALVGSANITAAALGWARYPNLELMISVGADHPSLLSLEEVLRRDSILATQELAEEILAAAELLPSPGLAIADSEEPVLDTSCEWYPRLREPFDLYTAYAEGPERLTRVSAWASNIDLDALQVPPNLDRVAFEAVIASRLSQLGLIRRLNDFMSQPRRFGEVRDLLQKELSLTRDESEHAWQTVMRWLLHFLPAHYVRQVHSHTEMFVYRPAKDSAE